MDTVKCLVVPTTISSQRMIDCFFDRLDHFVHHVRLLRLGMSTLEEWIRHAEKTRRLMSFEEFHSRNPHDPRISKLVDQIERISGFLLGLLKLVIFQNLMDYVETGRWNTYSNGAWEFRATYVSIERRLDIESKLDFLSFSERVRDLGLIRCSFSERVKNLGLHTCSFSEIASNLKTFGVRLKNNTKNGVLKYEPWVWFRKHKIYFEIQKSEEKAARIRDVAKYWLKSQGRDPLNFGEKDYNYLNFVQEFHPQLSDKEIKRFVLEYAQPFLKEVQQSQEVPIVYQGPYVEPARIASGEDWIIQDLSPFMELEEIPPDDGNEQTADMIEELQSVTPNPDIAGPTIEENIRERQEALISSTGPSLIQPKGTSEITLIAPCNGTGDVDLFTELKVFRKEKWTFAVVNFAPESYAHEGCLATMHKFVILRKSGDTQELSWSVEMEDKLDDFEKHGWKIQL